MLTGQTYVVTSPELCSAVQRAPSTLDLDPIIGAMTPRMLHSDAHTTSVLKDPSGGQEGGISIYKKAHSILTAQSFTDGTKVQLGFLGQAINDMNDECELDLFRFVRQTISTSTNRTFFGPRNPYDADPSLLDKFWDWESGLVGLMINIFPRITARKAYKGLLACARGFEDYIKAGGYEDAHQLVKTRNDLHIQHGLVNPFERGKLEVSLGLAINVNASIAAFWLLSTVCSRPELLSQLRDEIRSNSLVGPGVLCVERLQQACPILNSVYRGVLRLCAPMGTVRYVKEDTIIANRYLLRKGGIVTLAGIAMHHDKALWGPDVDSFNPTRFLYSMNGSKTNTDGVVPEDKAHTLHPASFRSFGGGASLCPGRNFARTEVLSLSAALLLGFDMDPVDGTVWNPPPERKKIPITAMKPSKRVQVKFRARKEFEGVKWELRL